MLRSRVVEGPQSRITNRSAPVLCMLLAGAAEANEVLWPGAVLVGLPLLASIFTVGGALAGITLVEALVLTKRENLKLLQALGLGLKANLFSTLLGAGAVFSYSSSAALLIGSAFAAWLLTWLLRRAERASAAPGEEPGVS